MQDLLAILALTVVAPIWIISHYVSKARSSKGLTPEDEAVMSEVWEDAKRMEERIHTLERILDDQSPGWRSVAQ
ncbi:MAG: envelope stress response membrane protein PspB [Pseudomonadota bacterium]